MKGLLREIVKCDGCVLEGVDVQALSGQLLEVMGSVDSELRDELGLTVLYTWMVDGILSTDRVKELALKAMDSDHLFLGLGTKDDRVFMRSFSALVVAAALARHRKESVFTTEEVRWIASKIVTYYREERDLRGYVDGKGWAHGAAHGADVLTHLCRMEEVSDEKVREILLLIRVKAAIDWYGYAHEEYERMNNAVWAAMESDRFEESFWMDWIKGFDDFALPTKYPHRVVRRSNISNFLRSLYFRIMDRRGYEALAQETLLAVMRWNPFR